MEELDPTYHTPLVENMTTDIDFQQQNWNLFDVNTLSLNGMGNF